MKTFKSKKLPLGCLVTGATLQSAVACGLAKVRFINDSGTIREPGWLDEYLSVVAPNKGNEAIFIRTEAGFVWWRTYLDYLDISRTCDLVGIHKNQKQYIMADRSLIIVLYTDDDGKNDSFADLTDASTLTYKDLSFTDFAARQARYREKLKNIIIGLLTLIAGCAIYLHVA